MKRLYFKKNGDILETEPTLCDKDVVKGEIYLNNDDYITWTVVDGNGDMIDSGECDDVRTAKVRVKEVIISCGGKFELEKRKYKI